MTGPDFAILLTTANRCAADRLLRAVTAVPGGEAMRSSFGFVLRAVAAERPTVSRLAELLGVSKQAASRMADDMVSAGFLRRGDVPGDRRRTPLELTPLGERIRAAALAESVAMEQELREQLGDNAVNRFRTVLSEFVQRNGAGDELAAARSRTPLTQP
jgi:DNA-binding MarR family transcriptional regulator